MLRIRRHHSARTVLVSGLALGLLIWAKLRLVTSIPRSALADPEVMRRATTKVERVGGPERAARERAVAEVPGTEPAPR